jgi:hypothetical protein
MKHYVQQLKRKSERRVNNRLNLTARSSVALRGKVIGAVRLAGAFCNMRINNGP